MKCPNCGAKMEEGKLYCEKCGEDIHIVPDFEPEIEQNIEQSIDRIVKEVSDAPAESHREQDAKPSRTGIFSGPGKTAGMIAGGILLLAALIFLLVRLFAYYSPDYQERKARALVEKEQYQSATGYYLRAIELKQTDIELKLELSQVYFLLNDKENYEFWLRKIVEDPYADSEQLGSAYGKLIAIYSARDDFETINKMLLQCREEQIRQKYRNYLAEPPTFSVEPGTYDSMQIFKLSTTGIGTIYYTTNGSEPDRNAEAYTAPIVMDDGDYLISAVFVNEKGVSSEIAHGEYHIAVTQPLEPELNVDDGEYSSPVMITVLNDTENVFYTTDGSVPGRQSTRYTEPIPMPLGVSRFKFIRITDDGSSAVVNRMFVLELQASYTPEQAVDQVREYLLSTGRIRDNSGHFDDTEACYAYQFLYVVTLDADRDFYVIAEELVDTEENRTRTGNFYAVDMNTNALYRLQIDSGAYTLVEI